MKKKHLSVLLLVLVSLLVTYFSLKDNFFEITKSIMSINLGWFFVAILLVFAYWCMRTLAIRSIMSTTDWDLPFSKLFRIVILGQFFSAVTPYQTGGQPLMVYYLRKEGIAGSKSSSVLVQEFIVFQLSLVLLGGLAVLLNYTFNIFAKVELLRKVVFLGFLFNMGIAITFMFLIFGRHAKKTIVRFFVKILGKIKVIKEKEKIVDRIDAMLDNFSISASTVFKNRNAIFKSFFYDISSLLLYFLIPLFVLFSFKEYTSMNVLAIMVGASYVMIVGSCMPTPGGAGGIEYAFVKFFGVYILGSNLVGTMLIWRFITFYFALIVGALLISFYRKGKKS